jgi:thiamine-phosphate pyrophosphorylase
MFVTDRTRTRLPLLELVRVSIKGGVNAIQIREKDLLVDELCSLTKKIASVAADEAWVVVNGNLDVAKALGIGVHLPERGPSVNEARMVLGKDAIVGRSVHSVDSAKDSAGADYLIAGHLFATTSKPGLPPMDIDSFRQVVEAAECPVLAIGGMTATSLQSAIEAGASGIAVIGAIAEAKHPFGAAVDLRAALDASYVKRNSK